MAEIVDTSQARLTMYSEGPYIRMNFYYFWDGQHRYFWMDSDGVRSDKTCHYTDSYLREEIDRLWASSVITTGQAREARATLRLYQDICRGLSRDTKESFWEWLSNVVKYGW
jgi:hypothetical protein